MHRLVLDQAHSGQGNSLQFSSLYFLLINVCSSVYYLFLLVICFIFVLFSSLLRQKLKL